MPEVVAVVDGLVESPSETTHGIVPPDGAFIGHGICGQRAGDAGRHCGRATWAAGLAGIVLVVLELKGWAGRQAPGSNMATRAAASDK